MKKKLNKKIKAKDLLLISWRKFGIIIIMGFVSILLHNVISALFKTEEAFFFILVIFVLPIYLLIIIIYSIIYKIIKRK
jgi:hypothetical protein